MARRLEIVTTRTDFAEGDEMLLKNSALADAAIKYAGRVSRALSKSTLMAKAKFKNSDDFVARKVSPPADAQRRSSTS
jgi:hypothetical protein